MNHATVHSIDLEHSVFAFKHFHSIHMLFDNRQTVFLHSLSTFVIKNETETHIPLYTLNTYELRITFIPSRVYRVSSAFVLCNSVNKKWMRFIAVAIRLYTFGFVCMFVSEAFCCFHYFFAFFHFFHVVQTCVRGERMFSSTNQQHTLNLCELWHTVRIQNKVSQTYGFKQPLLLVGIQYNGNWKKGIANYKRLCVCVFSV